MIIVLLSAGLASEHASIQRKILNAFFKKNLFTNFVNL